jgi:dolichol-phosphate mannosyltransferase
MATSPVHLSVVSPVYRAEACVDELYHRLTTVLSSLTDAYEIVLVEDCGPDRSWEQIQALAAQDTKVIGLQLSRNFGQHIAIAAGLTVSRGRQVVVMDCDLQDPPEMIPQLLAKAKEGFDIVYTQRRSREEPFFKQAAARLFFFLTNHISSIVVLPDLATLSVLSRQVVNEYVRTADQHSHYLAVLHWLGFRSTIVPFDRPQRFAGASSYSIPKLASLALSGIASRSTRLLHISTSVGLLFGVFAFLQICYLVYRKLVFSISVEGWASLMVVSWLVGGTVLFSLGVIGLYLSRLFEHTRRRPLFVIRSCTQDEE